MKLVINVPDYIKEQADDGKGEEFGIPLWLAYEIANGIPLPKGHGRLIDGDYLYKKFVANKCHDSLVLQFIKDEPTIIEADKGESEELIDDSVCD